MRSAYPDRVYYKWLVPVAAALVLWAAGYCGDGLTGAASMAGGKIAYAEEAADAPALITGIDVRRQEQDTLVTISGSKPLTYTAVKLQTPLKIMVDMPDCTMEKTMGPGGVDSDLVSEVTSQAIQKGEKNYLRVEIALRKDVTYTVNAELSNLVIRMTAAANPVQTVEAEAEAVTEVEPFAEAEAVAEAEAFGVEAAPVEEDLWAMEEIPETAEAEPWSLEIGSGASTEELMGIAEEAEVESALAIEAEPAVEETTAKELPERKITVPPLALPTKDDIQKMVKESITANMTAILSSIDIKEAVFATLTPLLKDSVEKVLWEVAPDLVEKMLKEMLKGSLESLTKEVEKVMVAGGAGKFIPTPWPAWRLSGFRPVVSSWAVRKRRKIAAAMKDPMRFARRVFGWA